MAELELLSNNSWKQPFKDRRKEMELWEIHKDLKNKFEDKTTRWLNIKFEDKLGIVTNL